MPNSTWVDRLARAMERLVPDAITTGNILMVMVSGLALILGTGPSAALDAYYRGLWSLRAFTMQMTLIMTYLLDTNACIALINGTPKDVRRRFQRAIVKEATMLVSSVVAFELWYGVAKSSAKKRIRSGCNHSWPDHWNGRCSMRKMRERQEWCARNWRSPGHRSARTTF